MKTGDNRMLTVAEAQTLARKVWKATLLCFSWKRAAAGLVLLGLILTAFGAAIAASGVILTPEQATELASTKWGENRELRAALLDQSAKAWGVNGDRGRHGDASGGDDHSPGQGGLGEDVAGTVWGHEF